MKAEQILEVLMDDKKYKAKVEELRALYDKLIEVKKIAATLDAAQAVLDAAKQREQDAKKRQADLEEEHRVRTKKLAEEVEAKKQELDARASKEREQYKDVRDRLIELSRQENFLKSEKASIEKKYNELAVYEISLKTQVNLLAEKIKRVNEAYNG